MSTYTHNNYYGYINKIQEQAIRNPEWFWSDDPQASDARQWLYDNDAEEIIDNIYDNTPKDIQKTIDNKKLSTKSQFNKFHDNWKEKQNNSAKTVGTVVAASATAPFILNGIVQTAPMIAKTLNYTNYYTRPSTYVNKISTWLGKPLSSSQISGIDTLSDLSIGTIQNIQSESTDWKDWAKVLGGSLLSLGIDKIGDYELVKNKIYKLGKQGKQIRKRFNETTPVPKITIYGNGKSKSKYQISTPSLTIDEKIDALGDYSNNNISLNSKRIWSDFGYNPKVINGVYRHEFNHHYYESFPNKTLTEFDSSNNNSKYPKGYFRRIKNYKTNGLEMFDKNIGIDPHSASPEEFVSEMNYLKELMGKERFNDMNKVQQKNYRNYLGNQFNFTNEEIDSALKFFESTFKQGGILKSQIGTKLLTPHKDYLGIPYKQDSDYNYFEAHPENMPTKPEEHWTSRNPATGQLLKSENHPTFNLLLNGEQEAGMQIYSGLNGELYSYPKEQQVPLYLKKYNYVR